MTTIKTHVLKAKKIFINLFIEFERKTIFSIKKKKKKKKKAKDQFTPLDVEREF